MQLDAVTTRIGVMPRTGDGVIGIGQETVYSAPVRIGRLMYLTQIPAEERQPMNSFDSHSEIMVGGSSFAISRLRALQEQGIGHVDRLPFSLRVLLENLLRNEDGRAVSADDIRALAAWTPDAPEREIAYTPARVLLQDFTGVPVVVDLAAMRDAIVELGGDPSKINPLQRVDLVIDHSVQVDSFAQADSFARNVQLEFERNQERYQFLRWGQQAFENFRVVPPGTGIVHQVNLEYLAPVVFTNDEGAAYPDTLVGTDSHTTMINGLGVLGWGVGGIEAEAAMLGQPVAMLIPDVVGFRLKGRLPEGATGTDLVLKVVQMLRERGVVGKFVEFCGEGLSGLSLAARATVANMAPEYGATVGFFPVDDKTLDYLRLSGREPSQVALVEAYCREQGLFRTDDAPEPLFSDTLELDLADVEPAISGPRRPQDRIPLASSQSAWRGELPSLLTSEGNPAASVPVTHSGSSYELRNGSVVIAAITSCTNTSNPELMLGAGLVAKKAVERGLTRKPWVKTSLAPGSQVVTDYLREAGLTPFLDELGFNLVGYGCTTCIGNSGALPEPVSEAIHTGNLAVTAVLSGNRNFEGRVNPDVRANYLASPPLVVAYALAGTMDIDLQNEAIGVDSDGKDVFLREIWPSQQEVDGVVERSVRSDMFESRYAEVFEGESRWKDLPTPIGDRYEWNPSSTYIRKPPFFEGMGLEPAPPTNVEKARILVMVGDSTTTDHISPAGNIAAASPAGHYLQEMDVPRESFNQYGARRGNHEVMMRGTYANIRLRNLVAPGTEGGFTRHFPDSEEGPIYDAAMKYRDEGVPLIVVAGKEYGSGSSRDWAAKGVSLLGVRACIAESYERIHRSNLVGMGVLPLQFLQGEGREHHGLRPDDQLTITGIADGLAPGKRLEVLATHADGSSIRFEAVTRIDTPVELDYYLHGGILRYVLRGLVKN